MQWKSVPSSIVAQQNQQQQQNTNPKSVDEMWREISNIWTWTWIKIPPTNYCPITHTHATQTQSNKYTRKCFISVSFSWNKRNRSSWHILYTWFVVSRIHVWESIDRKWNQQNILLSSWGREKFPKFVCVNKFHYRLHFDKLMLNFFSVHHKNSGDRWRTFRLFIKCASAEQSHHTHASVAV